GELAQRGEQRLDVTAGIALEQGLLQLLQQVAKADRILLAHGECAMRRLVERQAGAVARGEQLLGIVLVEGMHVRVSLDSSLPHRRRAAGCTGPMMPRGERGILVQVNLRAGIGPAPGSGQAPRRNQAKRRLGGPSASTSRKRSSALTQASAA